MTELDLARCLFKAGQFQDGFEIINSILISNATLSSEDRSIISFAFDTAIGKSRSDLLKLTEKLNSDALSRTSEYIESVCNWRKSILSEGETYCRDLIASADHHLGPHPPSSVTSAFHYQLKAEAWGFIRENSVGEEWDSAVAEERDAFSSAHAIAAAELEKDDPEYLKLVGQWAAFIREVDGKQAAIDLVERSVAQAVACVRTAEAGTPDQRKVVINCLRETVERWRSSDDA
jgi:hypothetical protein